MIKSAIAAGALCLSLAAAGAQAAVLWSFEETGDDVVGTLSGSLDLTGAEFLGSESVAGSSIGPGIGWVVSMPGIYTSFATYTVSGPPDFGSGVTTADGVSVGDPFLIYDHFALVGVADGYTSGSALNGTLTFAGSTFASLGIDPGSYIWSLPNDTVTLRFGPAPSAIPLPASLSLLLGALGLTFAATRRA